MSAWTYVMGAVRVGTPAHSTEQAEYIVKTVLNHLPEVTGSERNMRVIVVSSSNSCITQDWDEFGHGTKAVKRDGFRITSDYLLTVEGQLRDRNIEETYREIIRWLCRLAKRLSVEEICLKIKGNRTLLITDATPFEKMYETESNWVERIAGPKWWKEYSTL